MPTVHPPTSEVRSSLASHMEHKETRQEGALTPTPRETKEKISRRQWHCPGLEPRCVLWQVGILPI